MSEKPPTKGRSGLKEVSGSSFSCPSLKVGLPVWPSRLESCGNSYKGGNYMGMAAAAVPEMGEPINVATSLLPSMDGQTLLWSPQAIRWLACLPWEELLGLWCLTSTLDFIMSHF